MTPEKFYKLYNNEKFISLYRQVMAVIIAEKIMYFSERNEDGSFKRTYLDLDRFDKKIRDFCYDIATKGDGHLDDNLMLLRGLFPIDGSLDLVYNDDGTIDMDNSFGILYNLITSYNLIAILAGALPEDKDIK